MPAEPTDPPADPLGLTRPVHLRPTDRALGLLTDLGLTPRTAAVGCTACLLALVGWFGLRSPAPPPAEAGVPLTPAATGPVTSVLVGTPAATPTGTTVFAHAAGAVRRPGLYELAVGDRVADLLAAAGGPLPAADLDRINLAAPVADGTQVVVPRRGEPAPVVPSGDPAGSGTPGALVNINLAGPEELETLPGVGPSTAAAIIEYREASGPFTAVEQLIDVTGIGEAKLADLVDLVTV